jgi:pimeloyl-ACP methyl ester carboxylesterase
MSAETPRPLVLVPGACLGGWAYAGVARRLRAIGHDAYPVTLTGLGERVHLARPDTDLETHITDVVNLLDHEDLHDALLVGHSYSGIVVTGVADRRPERLNAVVYLDCAPVPDGMALAGLMPPEIRERQRRDVDERGDGWRWPVPDRDTLTSGVYGSTAGLTDEHLRTIEERGSPQPYATFTSPLRLRAACRPRVRRVAIFGSAGGMSLEILRSLAEQGDPRATLFAGDDWELHELPTGHWPMLSMPEELAGLLHRIAAV